MEKLLHVSERHDCNVLLYDLRDNNLLNDHWGFSALLGQHRVLRLELSILQHELLNPLLEACIFLLYMLHLTLLRVKTK